MLTQGSDAVERQVAGGITLAGPGAVIINPEVIIQRTADGIHAGNADVAGASTQQGPHRRLLHHQLQIKLAEIQRQPGVIRQCNALLLVKLSLLQRLQLPDGLCGQRRAIVPVFQRDLADFQPIVIQI
ncbi:hypothetical protein D3C81_1017820 [compost metagenome]